MSNRRRGLSLVELLMVIAICLVLLAITLVIARGLYKAVNNLGK